MKNFYITVSIKGNKGEHIFCDKPVENSDGYYAYVVKVLENDNVFHRLRAIRGLMHANIQQTKKEAYALADLWNESYKKNGTYLYQR